MSSAGVELKVAFLPFAAPGHLIPLMNIARLFARQGVDVTYITTPANAVRFQKDVACDFRRGYRIKILTFHLRGEEVGLPPDVESFNQCTSLEMIIKLHRAFLMLKEEIQQLLREIKADCIVSDTFLHWTTDVGTKLGIPRIVFQPIGFFAECIDHSLRCHTPHEKVGSDIEPFVVPGLPHKIELIRSHLPPWIVYGLLGQYFEDMKQANKKSYGVLTNSFYELEADYIEYFKSAIGLKTWVVGPVSLWVNEDVAMDDEHNSRNENADLIEWMDSKEPNSILYVSFGSMIKFPFAQLLEIAHGLEDSGHPFIWVIRKMKESDEADIEDQLPEGFEERVKQSNKGLIIRNWAPQDLILNHAAVGGFISHCGWNSTLESIYAGQPIIAWPLSSEQFFNEKFVTHILKIGVSVGVINKWWNTLSSQDIVIVSRDRITEVVNTLMNNDEEVVAMRDRVRELSNAAKRAIKEGGSSHSSLQSLIDELKKMKLQRQINDLHR